MRSLHVRRWLAYMSMSLLGAWPAFPAWAAQPAQSAAPVAAPAQPAQQFVDGIAAIVNKHVITLQQVNNEAKMAQAQMQRQNIPVPDHAVLQRQVLQRMITEELERQEAERLGIRVTDAQVDTAVQTISQRNRITPEQLRVEIEKTGVTWGEYLKDLRQEVRTDLLRQRAVDSTIHISDAEIDAFLKSQGYQAPVASPRSQPAPQAPAQQSGPRILGLAQILVAVPERASTSEVAALRKKAESLLAQVRSGADFAGVAAASSDGPQALHGGELGVRPVDGWPDLFISATQNLEAGQISDIIQSGNGFHILKVLTRGQPSQQARPDVSPAGAMEQGAPAQQGPMMVTQTHARHILIKTTAVMSDAQAQARLEQLRQRILNGESFEDLARRTSDDASAPQGGDLGWLTPGETVPAFERAMNALEPNQISQPVRSQFGWHLIQVLERRTKNMENEFRRMQARQLLFQRRVEPAFEDWLNQLRGQAYIDNRLDPASNRGRR